jgi:type IV pilus assembly protein PilY1
MRSSLLRTLAALAILAVLSFPHDSASQACNDPQAARAFYAGALGNSVVNPSNQEDNQFFTSSGGIPNIYFLMDTGVSMGRLPPNGPASLGLPASGAPGCDADPSMGGLDASAEAMITLLAERTYHSPCGTTTKDNLAYDPSQDYWALPTVCPYVDHGTGPTKGMFITPSPGGYDPNWSGLNSQGNAFFPEAVSTTSDSVFHGYGSESVGNFGRSNNCNTWNSDSNVTATGVTATGGGGTAGKGWDFAGTYPYTRTTKSGNKCDPASINDFCSDTSIVPAASKSACLTCLYKKGWYYDGALVTGTYDGQASVQYPSIWYTGNYLSFFPPKFVVARKLVKDTIGTQLRVRLAVSGMSASGFNATTSNGGDLSPNCQQSLNDQANWISNRGTVVNDIDNLSWGKSGTWSGIPVLSQALFDVGDYYHSPSLPWFGDFWQNTSTWPSYFTAGDSDNQRAICWQCQVTSVILLSDGVTSPTDGAILPPAAPAPPASATCSLVDANKESPAGSGTTKYAGDVTSGILGCSTQTSDCPQCSFFPPASDFRNNLARVAFYLHNYDLRNDAAGQCSSSNKGRDGLGMDGKQVLDVYTVGFAAGKNSDGSVALGNAAKVGGGKYVYAEAADDLKAGLLATFNDINTRATSFSVATVSTLQTTTGHSVIVPRFVPAQAPDWQGHLSRYELYSEFVNGCTPGTATDYDCDGSCTSVFLVDKNDTSTNRQFIAEDGSGNFVLTTDHNPPCSQTPLCARCANNANNVGNVSASPWWDASDALTATAWSNRYVYSIVDDSGDGKINANDTVFKLRTDGGNGDAVADKLIPYMALGLTPGGLCDSIANKISTAGDPITAAIVRTSKRDCAKAIVRWLLGADVFNEAGRTPAQGWPPAPSGGGIASPTNPPNQEALPDRPFKLGDIYHSSPVVVDPPLPSDGILCPNGLHNQCIESLWRTPTNKASDVNQYDLYSKSTTYQNRRKAVLVGANDGLFHAFNGGAWHAGQRDPVAWNGGAGIDTSLPPFNGYFDRGDASELWAFLPPDLIAKLPLIVAGTTVGDHQLMVDGTAMVRDVWVDGTSNSPTGFTTNGGSSGFWGGGSRSSDGEKLASEFHTVAVVGERRGGTHYFALDVTNSTGLDGDDNGLGRLPPKFLWVYPQPNDPVSSRVGETYDDFLPVPPPIGPVRIYADGGAQDYGLHGPGSRIPSMNVPGGGLQPYNELWVTILPGGFDQNYLRGRGVHMVDVWTGNSIWDFEYPTNGLSHPTGTHSNDPRMFLQYPVVATPAMVMWGTQARRPSLDFENDGFFDTATFGDTGGQLWALRFNRPGTMNSSGKVTNWFGGRTFVQGGLSPTSATGSFCPQDSGLPFFYITANTALPGSHVFRVFAGTGDRFNLLDLNGGTCGPDNLRACQTNGCSVVATPLSNNYEAETTLGFDRQSISGNSTTSGLAQCGGGTNELFARTFDPSGAASTCSATVATQVVVSGCPNPTGSTTGFTKDVALRCDQRDSGGNVWCRKTQASDARATYVDANAGGPVPQTLPATFPAQSLNWYFSLKVFEDTGERTIFDAEADAANYDYQAIRFKGTVTSLTTPIAPSVLPAMTNHVTSNGIVVMDSADNAPTVLADASSTGWAIFYDHGPQITTPPPLSHIYSVSQLDERTSSVTGIYGSVFWNSLQPALFDASNAVSGCAASKCTAASYRLSYHYGADAISGGTVLTDTSGNPTRALVKNTLVPAQGDQPTVFVNQKGQLAVGLTSVNPEKGASNVGMSAPMDPVMGIGVTEVSRSLHACRHAPGTSPPDPKNCK